MATVRLSRDIYHAHQLMRSELLSALSPMHLTPEQYGTLAALHATPGMSGAELARRSFVRPQTMHTIIDGMYRRGMLYRVVRPGNGRAMELHLTERGEFLYVAADELVIAAEARMAGALSKTEQAQLTRLLLRLATPLGHRAPAEELSTES